MMNKRELTAALSAETGLPTRAAARAVDVLLNKFVLLIESGQSFRAGRLRMKSVSIPERPSGEDKPARKARKFAKLTISAPRSSPIVE